MVCEALRNWSFLIHSGSSFTFITNLFTGIEERKRAEGKKESTKESELSSGDDP